MPTETQDKETPQVPTGKVSEQMQARAEVGKEVIQSNRAQGEPGTKQESHKEPVVNTEKTVAAINDLLKQVASEPKKSSAERSKESGNPNPTPPEERTLAQQNSTQAQNLAVAAGHLAAAKGAFENQVTADARLLSDPRYERDQKVLEMAQMGKLGLVPKAPEELASEVARVGPAIVDATPKTPEEQAERDMARLKEGEEAAEKQKEMLNPTIENAKKESERKDRVVQSVKEAQATDPNKPHDPNEPVFPPETEKSTKMFGK